MRRRWEVNWFVVVALAVAWFFLGFALALLEKPAPHVPPPLWVFATWLGPYLLGALALGGRELARWARSEDGWLVRRVWEPVTEDLRERELARGAATPHCRKKSS